MWLPDQDTIENANLTQLMHDIQITDIHECHAWSVKHYEKFWDWIIKKLTIQFHKPYSKICDLSEGIENPNWLVDAEFNIVDSCLQADPNAIAIIESNEAGQSRQTSYSELATQIDLIANALQQSGYVSGDAIAIAMPMTTDAVAIYLAIIKIGCVAVGIADSFAPEEIRMRLQIANCKAIFTQDVILRNHKPLPLYEKVVAAGAEKIYVLAAQDKLFVELREHDETFTSYMDAANKSRHVEMGFPETVRLRPAACPRGPYSSFLRKQEFPSVKAQSCKPNSPITILFSSGTTSTPKAIPWTQTTPIKVASDAYFHQNIKPNDILCWPTNLGWMMGPWLIFAALLNKASIALFNGAPTTKKFGEFIQQHNISMLGLVPSLVKAWRSTKCMEDLDWSSIKVFSSSGECSNADDMQYLMFLASNKTRPIIEYCGGTEIGGAYITSTVLQPNIPATFSTPAMGSDFCILDENNNLSDTGEIGLFSPAIGLSTTLLNKDHHEIYFQDMPEIKDRITRRHGDQAKRLSNGYYQLIGRADDTMNLGGIKIGAADIERALVGVEGIIETAAIGIAPPKGGPTELIIYAVPTTPQTNKNSLLTACQHAIKTRLNPLFKISDLILIDKLPRTASNKIMRRMLRKQ